MATDTLAPVISSAVTISFGTSSYAPNIIDITLPAAFTREFEDVSHQGTTGMIAKRRKALFDAGEWGFTHQYSPNNDIPIDGGSEEVTITVTSGGTTIVFQTAMSGHDATGPHNALMTGTATFMVLGQIVVQGSGSPFTIG